MLIWAGDVVRKRKEQRKQEREARREQDKRDKELRQKARVASARKITALESKIRSQTEAAKRLDCVIINWPKKRI